MIRLLRWFPDSWAAIDRQAAEERARDIARVVAETAGAGSAAISRQFDAVRTASEEEHRQTVNAMHQVYEQTTQEADSMFKQSAEKFGTLVQSWLAAKANSPRPIAKIECGSSSNSSTMPTALAARKPRPSF